MSMMGTKGKALVEGGVSVDVDVDVDDRIVLFCFVFL